MKDTIWPREHRDWVQGLPALLGPRKFRLLANAWCRILVEPEVAEALTRHPQLARVQRGLEKMFESCDRFADTGKAKRALSDAQLELESYREATPGNWFRAPVLIVVATLLGREPEIAMRSTAMNLQISRCTPLAELMPLLREIVADLVAPEGAVSDRDAAARTPEVVEFAQSIYQQREFHRLPELAEALERAGCRNEPLLAHCRAEGPHVRGCWVLDWVLGPQISKPPRTPPPVSRKRCEILDRVLHDPLETVLAVLTGEDARYEEQTAPGKPNQHFGRAMMLESTLIWAVLEHLGYGPVADLGVRLHKGVDRAVDYFHGDWWKWNEVDAIAMDKSRPDRELSWFSALPKGLLLCGLTGRWEDAAKICSWFDDRIHMEPRFELNDYEYQGIYFCIISSFQPKPSGLPDVPATLEELRQRRPKRPRLLGAVWEAVLSLNQEAFDKALAESLAYFSTNCREQSPNPNFWIAREESLMWLIAEKQGLRFPTLPPKSDALVIRRQTIGLA